MSERSFPRVFLTVGTTEFDELIQYICENSHIFFETLRGIGCNSLTLQIGRGRTFPASMINSGELFGIYVDIFRFKPSLSEDMSSSDLIISHCGSGSVIEALSLDKLLVVVVNDTLQGNHQTELSDELSSRHHCFSTDPSHLIDVLKTIATAVQSDQLSTKPFPKADHSLFPQLLDSLFP